MMLVPPLTRRHLLALSLAGLAGPALGQGVRRDKPDEGAGGPDIAGLVDQVSQQRLEADVAALSRFPTRWTPGPDFSVVEEWVAEAFARGGAARDAVLWQPYTHSNGMTRHNIVCGDPMDPRGVILVGAHFDSISESPETLAPGANDNASGVSALLEAQRIFAGMNLGRGLVFVAFSGEEQGLQGSNACAAIARREGWPIALMLNLDMLGMHPDNPAAPLYIEYDQGNVVAENNAPAMEFGLVAARLAAEHTTLNTEHTDIWDSDYMGFEAQGFPCIGFYDGGVETSEYHSTTDVAEAMDFPRLAQVVRLLVATLATVAGPA